MGWEKLRKLLLFNLVALLEVIFILLAAKFIIFNKVIADFQISPKSFPKTNRFVPPPATSAESILVMDVDSGAIIFQKKPHLKLHPASITKMATAITALEAYPIDEVITIKEEYSIGKTMELLAGERITVENLIYGLLIHSANDAAYILAGQNDEQVRRFVERMNDFVRRLGLKETNFVNFNGEDDEGHYSTAFDLAHLARWALKNKIFSQAVQIKNVTVESVDGLIEHQLEATNELLDVLPEVRGIKTGWTPQAGECFIGLIDLGDHQLITVILGSQDRFLETRKLIDWSKEAVSWLDYDSDHSIGGAGT